VRRLEPDTAIVFFRVTCPTCKLTLPYLHRLGVKVLGVSQDSEEDTEKFARDYGVKVEWVREGAEDGYPLSNEYRITNVPTLFVLDGEGKVKMRVDGFDREAFEDLGLEFGAEEIVPRFKPG
jgi:peroxiredoxin